MPATKVTTAITAATPITIASTERTERSLFAHSDCNATRMASEMFMDKKYGLPGPELGRPPRYCDTPDSYCKGIWAGERSFSSVFQGRVIFRASLVGSLGLAVSGPQIMVA